MDRHREAQSRPGRALSLSSRERIQPDPKEIEALITSRTRAIVVINPNNPTGAVYSRATLEAIARSPSAIN